MALAASVVSTSSLARQGSSLSLGNAESDDLDKPGDELVLVVRSSLAFATADRRCLTLAEGDVFVCWPEREAPSGWARGRNGGREGVFPLSYVRALRMVPPRSSLPLLEAAKKEEAEAARRSAEAARRSSNAPQLLMLPGRDFREKLWLLMDDADSSALAYWWMLLIMALIFLSVLLFVAATLPQFWDGPTQLYLPFWETMEAFVTIVFTIEYVTRLTCTYDSRLSFVVAPLNLVDLVAIAPFWITLGYETFSGGSLESGGLAVLRLARVFRVVKLFKYSSGLQMFGKTMANSLNALLLQFLLMFLAAILFASLIYFVEQGEWDDEQGLWIYPEGSSTADGEASAFTSIVKGLWWCITTITTVGYGDMFPRTPGGKLVAICTFGAGLLSIAVPVAVVASNFSEQYEERKTKKDLGGEGPQHILVGFRNTFLSLRSTLAEMHLMLARLQHRAQNVRDLMVAPLRKEALKVKILRRMSVSQHSLVLDAFAAAPGAAPPGAAPAAAPPAAPTAAPAAAPAAGVLGQAAATAAAIDRDADATPRATDPTIVNAGRHAELELALPRRSSRTSSTGTLPAPGTLPPPTTPATPAPGQRFE